MAICSIPKFVSMDKLKPVARVLHVSSIWLVPIVLVVLESLVFVSKQGWQTHNIIYYIAFWIIRILLTPLIIYYTQRFWVEQAKKLRLIITHLAGFFIYSLLFTSIAYLCLHRLLDENDFPFSAQQKSKAYIYGLIADNSISINVVVYLSTVVICYILVYSKRAVAANQKAMELQRTLVTSRLDVLRNQLNTHFLFNTLHTINSLVTQGKKEQASGMIIKLSDLLRFALKDNQQQLIPLAVELEMLQSYIDIIMARFGNKLQIEVYTEERFADYLIPAFVLQPLLENAIKHGVEPLMKGSVMIAIKQEMDTLIVSVSDNGNKPFKDIDFSTGVGINNTRERLNQLYGKHYSLCFRPNKGDGITVTLKLPIQTSIVYEPESINSRR